MRAALLGVAVLTTSPVAAEAPARPPDLVYVLLDTTRADHIGAWGHAAARTPALDALAARGIRFARHYANSHATRPSMPQLMSGRYYHPSILRDFERDRHPRELSFRRPDPGAVLLPRVLVDAGYQAVGASAHPWVVAESVFGRPFERLELVTAEPARGHADARATVDRAIAAWTGRDRGRPTFLYVHLMDAHMPRFVPAGATLPSIPGYDPASRFAPNGEPRFDSRRRRWDRMDASDFTAEDRRWFAAVYDANLSALDTALARLLHAVLADDPSLAHTLVVVTADHGEELGEDGRKDHGDSLADGVQHVPWILAGAGIRPAQVVHRFTEHVDVLPTVLGRLGVRVPDGTTFDGIDRLTADGVPCAACGKPAVYYAWEEYRGVRTRRLLLRQNRPQSFEARCDGAGALYGVVDGHLRPADDRDRSARLRAGLHRRLAGPARRYDASGWDRPSGSVTWPARFWTVAADAPVACRQVGVDTGRAALAASGWLWSGRGVTVLHADHDVPLHVGVPAPDGEYRVEAGAVPIDPMPWLLRFGRWTRRSFLPSEPTAWIDLGTQRASRGQIALSLAEIVGSGRHILGLRLTPVGSTPSTEPDAADPALRRRLEALGYVQ